MKLQRKEDNYGGGSGKEIFESDFFRIVHWIHYSEQKSTTLELKLCNSKDIRFDGWQEITTNELCMEQLIFSEVLTMIDYQKGYAYSKGQRDKMAEIRLCIGLNK